jgi:type II secretory pathway component GspD/PulD (secretin)
LRRHGKRKVAAGLVRSRQDHHGEQIGRRPDASASSRGGRNDQIAAAFDAFTDRKDDEQSAGATTAGSSGRAIFQNVRITADTSNNAIVVYSHQEDCRVIERALRDVDRPRLQVAIDATVAEITLTDDLRFGVQYFLTSKDTGARKGKGSIGLLNAAANECAVRAAAARAASSKALPSCRHRVSHRVLAAVSAAARALGWAATLALLRTSYARIRQREGSGFGDVKLAAAVGAWCRSMSYRYASHLRQARRSSAY